MSHYAKIVQRVDGWILGMPATLKEGTEIKNVSLKGTYACDARVGEKPQEWHRFVTQADLPKFTDKGREHRANGRKRPTLSKGRPAGTKKSSTPPTKAGGLRMRPDQWAALDEGCKASDTKRNEAIVGALILAGLVPQ